jgi:hypothetical protein
MSTRHFLRIPGRGDECASAKLLIDGESISVAELVGRLSGADVAIRSRAISILERIPSPSRGDIHTIANALHSLARDTSRPEAPLYESALNDFIRANASHPEALSIGAQLLRIENNRDNESHNALVLALKEALDAFPVISALSPKQEIIETRYVLLRAFEAQQLASIAMRHISAFLRDQTPTLAAERKVWASQLLPLLRSSSATGASNLELKRLATCVFTTGFTSSVTRTSPPPLVGSNHSTLRNEPVSPDITPAAAGLIQKLVADERYEFVARLMPQDFQVLRQVTGLKLETFRLLTERIRRRAASDPWARIAVLDLVRSPHEPDVTARVRTAVLGALVNDARRLGKLSTQLEKEVFAISAEIPDLPFLSPERTEVDEHVDITLANSPNAGITIAVSGARAKSAQS